MTTLLQCKPGQRFQLADPQLPLTGILEMVNECRARVRLDRAAVDVEFIGSDGEERRFKATRGHTISWSPQTEVRLLANDGTPPPPTIMGHPVDAVLRWCGAQGWSVMEAKSACLDLRVPLAGTDVRTEITAGMRGAPHAALTPRQAAEMGALL